MARGYLTPYRGGAGLAGAFGGGSLFDLHRQMNRLFDDLLDQGSTQDEGRGGMLSAATMSPPALDVHQDDKQFEITAELPGVKEEDVDLSIEDGVLTLSGEKRSEREDPSGYSERSYGRFERRITLPSTVDEEHCTADFKNGVLTITLPKTEERDRARRIPLGGNGARGGKQAESASKEQGQGKSESAKSKTEEKEASGKETSGKS